MKRFLPLAFLLACAKSAAPPAEPPPPPFLPTVRDQIVAYIKANRLEKPIVIGHSLGGSMSLWLAETTPDLGGIIVVDGLPFYPAAQKPGTTAAESEPIAKQMRDQFSGLTSAQLLEAMRGFLGQMITKDSDVDKVVTRAGQSDPGSVGQAFYELFTNDLRPDLPKIKIPVLIVAAGLGPVPRDQLEAVWHAQIDPIPDKRLVFVDGAKHFVMLDQPEKFYALVDEFLAKR